MSNILTVITLTFAFVAYLVSIVSLLTIRRLWKTAVAHFSSPSTAVAVQLPSQPRFWPRRVPVPAALLRYRGHLASLRS
jgi:hypothetical protein